MDIDGQVLSFFSPMPAALPLYQELERRILAAVPGAVRKVQKTQIAFSSRRLFACASLMRVRKAKDLPSPYLAVTFGLPYRLDSPRVSVAVEPYPGRWTHHVAVGDAAEIDGELVGWLQEAAAFSAAKR